MAHDAPLGVRVVKHVRVRLAGELFCDDRAYVLSLRGESPHDVGVDVLVGEQREVERLQAEIFRSSTISLFIVRAAYASAAVSPASVTCG